MKEMDKDSKPKLQWARKPFDKIDALIKFLTKKGFRGDEFKVVFDYAEMCYNVIYIVKEGEENEERKSS